MNKGKSNGFDLIRDATRIVEQNEAMKSFFKDRIAELNGVERKLLQIIARHQPISECDLRSHTRTITKVERATITSKLWVRNIVLTTAGKLTVHPAFMEVI